ncbi:hypothetical protein [Paenibacillus sp. LjRoot56]|uniref:hypothetical protein n=1 Tax=Paenibacillus sp. LjRoot56 TaxID=3342333 RepID=UPI003ED07A52
MNFHQMIPLIPLIDHIQVASSTLAITSSPSKYQLVIVRQGHLTLHFAGHEPIICSQAYACHPDQGDKYLERRSSITLSSPIRCCLRITIGLCMDTSPP